MKLRDAGYLLVLVMSLGPVLGCGGDLPPQRPLGSIPTEDLIYNDERAGFTLALPPAWHDRYDVDARSGPIAAAQWPYASDAVAFTYKPVEPDQPQPTLLMILVYRREDWNSIAAESGKPHGIPVAQQADDVYIASVADSNPFEGGSRDADHFNAMRLTVDQVKDALTLH
jgi:hypothetical protein